MTSPIIVGAGDHADQGPRPQADVLVLLRQRHHQRRFAPGPWRCNTTTAFTAAEWQLDGRHQREPPHGGPRFAAAHGTVLARPDPDVSVRQPRRRRAGRGRGVCTAPTARTAWPASGKAPGSIAKADISAWLFDVRAGFQIGPLLLEACTCSPRATRPRIPRSTTCTTSSRSARTRATWRTGARSSASLGLDYFSAMNEAAWRPAIPACTIGWDKYGRHQIGAKASYFLTPNLSASAGASVHLTHRTIDTDAITAERRRWCRGRRSPPGVCHRQAGR